MARPGELILMIVVVRHFNGALHHHIN